MFRLREAIARAEMHGLRVKRTELGKYIFPECSEQCAINKVGALMNGKVAGIKPVVVQRVCSFLGCDANFLFGIDKMQDDEKDA